MITTTIVSKQSYCFFKSSVCLSNSFESDKLKTILIVTITASIAISVMEGTKIVMSISLPTSKSNASSKLLDKPSLAVSRPRVRYFVVLLKFLRNEIRAITIATPIIMPAIMSIPNVRYLINQDNNCAADKSSPSKSHPN